MAAEEEEASGLTAARVEAATTEPLLAAGRNECLGDCRSCNSLVLVSTSVAVCGSYAFGNAVCEHSDP